MHVPERGVQIAPAQMSKTHTFADDFGTMLIFDLTFAYIFGLALT
jgi:hypothetical protein